MIPFIYLTIFFKQCNSLREIIKFALKKLSIKRTRPQWLPKIFFQEMENKSTAGQEMENKSTAGQATEHLQRLWQIDLALVVICKLP